MSTENLTFTTELPEVRGITIDGKAYYLRGLTGTERDKYLTKTSARIKYEKGSAAGMKDLDGLQGELIAASLRAEDGDKLVPLATIQAWPAKVSTALYKKARELSALGEDTDEVEKAKNVSSASASSGSDSLQS